MRYLSDELDLHIDRLFGKISEGGSTANFHQRFAQ